MNVRERSASRPDAAPAGDLAARYRSLFEIGRGGMGTIEVALELGESERIVALKRMHPGSSRERRQVEMFLREARLAVQLVHPNVVHAFDFGEIEGELFMAMEYVEGETLSAMVRVARETAGLAALPPALVAAILADACEGLHAAHELRDPQTGAALNVIHRDVSPHNVMVWYEGHVKLLDFGVAKMDAVDPLTRTGEVKGKTAYMSPEQAMGDPLDRRSDLFSLGAVLFECVSGRRMYGNGTDLEVLRKLALEEPPSLADAAPLAPQALVELHARLVAHKPEGRPVSALAVAQELRAYVGASGVRADSSAIAAAMTTFFAEAAAERKRRLNEALTKQVPAGRVAVLRRSLAGPTALAGLTPRMAPPRPMVGASAAPARINLDEFRSESLSPRATRSGVVASALLGLAFAVGIVAFTTTRSSAPPPAVTPSSTPPPSASASPPAPAIPSASASPSSSSSSASTASASAPAPSAPHHPVSHHPKPASSSRPVDVDPNPL